MKQLICMLFLALPFMAGSQNMYNVTNLLENDPSGTARFISMGGSMGALGGDLSVMGTNPAGTAVYRSSDFNLTGIYDIVNNRSVFGSERQTANYNSADLGNLGFVVAYEIEASPIKFVNFGGNFRRKANIRNNFSMAGFSNGYSQQYVMDYLYNQNKFDTEKISAEMYDSFDYNWLTLLAVDAGMCDADGNFLFNQKDGNLLYLPTDFNYYSEQRGNLDVFDMNLSFNINDRVYIGATLGYYNFDYSRYSFYAEYDEIGKIYSLENYYNINASGFDFKLGAIFRPFRYSPLKVGAFMHTPVGYKLVDYSSAIIEGPHGDVFDTYSKECYGDDVYVYYNLRTPWRFGAALSYTFGKMVALNAEYEFADASGMSFTDGYAVDRAQNEEISYNLKPQHTVRFGAELSLKSFSLRAGYNYISSPFRSNAYKCIDNAVITDTSTEFLNRYDKNIFTFGAGYVVKGLYFDIAYMYQMQKADFYPYDDVDNPATKVKTNTHSIVASLGFRF